MRIERFQTEPKKSLVRIQQIRYIWKFYSHRFIWKKWAKNAGLPNWILIKLVLLSESDSMNSTGHFFCSIKTVIYNWTYSEIWSYFSSRGKNQTRSFYSLRPIVNNRNYHENLLKIFINVVKFHIHFFLFHVSFPLSWRWCFCVRKKIK